MPTEEKKQMTFDEFIEHISAYESDTFSALTSKIMPEEAKEIAEKILHWVVEHKLDGILISLALGEIRSVESFNV